MPINMPTNTAAKITEEKPINTGHSRLYYSTVMHHRVKPVAHKFTYQVGTFLLDLDELGDAIIRLQPIRII